VVYARQWIYLLIIHIQNALHLFVAKMVDEMQQELKELHQEFLQEGMYRHVRGRIGF
jgi:hypothetical protein